MKSLPYVTTNRGTVEAATSRMLITGASIFFLVFAGLRAVQVPLTYDEAAAYLRYISTDTLSVFNFAVATNHLLNTLLTRLFYIVGGDSELVLRMPNLIGYGMYLLFSFLILDRFTHRLIACAGFLLLNLNPYVLDFFSLSRGYGLSLGFLMGALFFLFRFLTKPMENIDSAHPDLPRALLMACGAVAANLALLNVYLGVFVVGLAAVVLFNSTGRRLSAPLAAGHPRIPPHQNFVWLALGAAVFSGLVLSQDLDLSRQLYEPVAVRIAGLSETELDAVKVYRIDVRGRATRLPRHGDLWRLDRPTSFCGLRFELPLAAIDHLALMDIILGSRPFSYDTRRLAALASHDKGGTRVFEIEDSVSLRKSIVPVFRPVINWGGDSRYVACLAGKTILVVSIFGVCAAALWLLGRLAVRVNVLKADQWRPLAASALMMAALLGCPLYVLMKNAELYYGGSEGLVHDTFYSVIDGSFYGRQYHAAQTEIVFRGIVVSVVVCCIVLCVSYRLGKVRRMLPLVSVAALMSIASLSVVGQRLIFETPYLLGRTALFFVPLYLLFVVLLCDAIAAFGPLATKAAVAVLSVAVSLSLYHFWWTANLKYTSEWRPDADTKVMIADLGHVLAMERPERSTVSLGVDWMYYPVAVFYANRSQLPVIDVDVVPSSRTRDFLYLQQRNLRDSMHVIRRYPVSGSILARADRQR